MGQRFGDLNAIANDGMDHIADEVAAEGGVAIAAHIDGQRGFWSVAVVGARRQELHACTSISAFEVEPGDLAMSLETGALSGYERRVACVQGSDSWTEEGDAHRLDGIGQRFCFMKMDSVSVEGLRQAFLDPDLRIRSVLAPPTVPDSHIEGLFVSDGFLRGQNLRFSPGITCLIGGTGAGKSLSLELVRFALDQQVDASILPGIAKEVSGLLGFGLSPAATVSVLVSKAGERFLVERTWLEKDPPEPAVSRVTNDGLVEPLLEAVHVPTFIPIKAFSQSEIIEYAREPLARLSLIDDLIDIGEEANGIAETKRSLRENATQVIEARRQLEEARVELRELPGIQEQIRGLERFFEDERVRSHQEWEGERILLDYAEEALTKLLRDIAEGFDTATPAILPADEEVAKSTPNPDVLETLREIAHKIASDWPDMRRSTINNLNDAGSRLTSARRIWDERFAEAEREYVALLAQLDEDGVGRVALNDRLRRLREGEVRLRRIAQSVGSRLEPALHTLDERRETLLTALQQNRRRVTARRQEKARELTLRLNDQVRVRIDSDAEGRQFFEGLRSIRPGSYVSDSDLQVMAEKLHPVRFAKSLLSSDMTPLAAITGLPEGHFERLREVVMERGLISDLYELQIADINDSVEIQFAVEGQYRELKALAHGQKCTVVLMISLAEGDSPLLVDQPEDALHAPWIEQYIVRQLRSERGNRQCVFATRSANVLVSADAEQILAMDSNANNGWVKKAGGMDLFDTRDLVLYHVEGGREAFSHRRNKYGI